MNQKLPFACRPLDAADLDEARGVARDVGVHGVYVRNSLDHFDHLGRDQVYGLYGAERLLGLVYFGARGNLIVVEPAPLDPDRLAKAIRECPWEWRIALARPELVLELRRLEVREPIVDRRQSYYAASAGQLAIQCLVPGEARRAERQDIKVLTKAALELNESDLHVAPWRVHRGWLRDTIRRRVQEGTTWVIGPLGTPWCKLDVGSSGSAGVVVEGVYTLPNQRGRGLATRLVTAVAHDWFVGGAARPADAIACLHVASSNVAARRAYEKCGMQARGECSLLLRG